MNCSRRLANSMNDLSEHHRRRSEPYWAAGLLGY
jgi:hypothetical protein